MPYSATNLPANLKTRRLACGYTQTQIAEMIGVKQNTYSDWECGTKRPSVEAVSMLAFVLNCTVNDLLCAAEERK